LNKPDYGDLRVETIGSHIAIQALFVVVVIFALALVGSINLLLFHSLVELFGIAIGWSAFALAWNARHLIDDDFLLLLGFPLLFIGLLNLVHILAFPDFGIFKASDAALSSQFWIASRYLQSISLLIAGLSLSQTRLVGSRHRSIITALAYLLLSILLVGLAGGRIVPGWWVEPGKMTVFYLGSEYLITAIFFASLAVLFLRRNHLEKSVYIQLSLAIIAFCGSELSFALRAPTMPETNLTGHLLNAVGLFLIYNSVVRTGLIAPQRLLFRNLKLNEEALRRSHDQLRALLNTTGQAFYLIGHDRRLLTFNNTAREEVALYAGVPIKENDLMESFLVVQIVDGFEAGFAAALQGQPTHGVGSPVNRDGRKEWLEYSFKPLFNEQGGVNEVCLNTLNVTGRKRAEQAQEAMLRISQAAFTPESLEQLCANIHTILLDLMAVPNLYIALYDQGKNQLSFPYYSDQYDINPGIQPLSHGLTDYILRTKKSLLLPIASYNDLVKNGEIDVVGTPAQEYLGIPLLVEGQAMGILAIQSYESTDLYSPKDLALLEFVGIQIAAAIYRKQSESRLVYMSTHDVLTGLYNRAYFDEEMKRLENSRRYPVSIIFGDVDDLKMINDTLGHLQGDAVLHQAAALLGRCFRTEDLVARVGGDEFAVILPETDEEGIREARERVQAAIDAQQADPAALHFTLSLGAATAQKGEFLRSALILADQQMYLKKKDRHSANDETSM